MKKILTLFLGVLVSMAYLKAEAYEHLVIVATDGTNVTYCLKQKPKVTFSATDIMVANNGLEIVYPLAQTARFEYEITDDNSEGIDVVTQEQLVGFTDDALVFKRLNDNTVISIYTMSGQTVLSRTISTSGEYMLPVDFLSEGVYLVNINSLTYKIVKK